jgi:copper chaperone CopZ
MNKAHFQVQGLINNPVKQQVKNVLADLPGVANVNVDLVRSTVEVEYNPPADESQIRKSIEHTEGCRIL